MTGCATLRAEIEPLLFERDRELAFDRPIDLLPPERIHVVNTEERQITIAWDPVLVGDVAGYAILRSRDARGPFGIAGRTVSRFGTVFTDAGREAGSLGDAKTYYYRVHAFDALGRVSRSHAFIPATTDPAPDVPQGLRAYSNRPRLVVLTWDASPSRSVAGYGVYRAPTAAGPWDRVAHVEGRFRTVHEDAVAGDLRVMYYRLTAMNRYGGESGETQAVRAVTKAEPLPPIGLGAVRKSLGSIDLRWEPNVERDLVAYEVWRSRFDGDQFGREARIGRVPAEKTELQDAEVGCGERVRYRLLVRDADGLVSEFSRPLEAEGADIGLRAKPSPEGPLLLWDARRAEPWAGARVYRRRRFLPDVLLAEVTGQAEIRLAGLESGTHRLAVVLVRPAEARVGSPVTMPGATASVELAPPCPVELELP
jgi:fibronectin type 3 domain-containing protein